MTNLNHRDENTGLYMCINELIRTAKQEIKSYLPEEKRMWSRDDVQ